MSKQCDLKLHEPVCSSRVVPRWQRKENEKSSRPTSKSNSNNASFSSQSNVSSTFGESFSGPAESRKTPSKPPSLTLNMPYKTTNRDGTPKKKVSSSLKNQIKVGTPKKMSKTRDGKRSAHTTPSCDRFIPPRSGNNFENAGFELLNDEDESKDSPTTRRYKDGMKQNLNIGQPKILNMKNKAPAPAMNLLNSQSKVLFAQSGGQVNRKASARAIPQTAWRVLDAPDVNNDYYLNLLDWSVGNYLCVALNTSVFLWNAGSGDIMELTEHNSQVASVRWSPIVPEIVAIGDYNNKVCLWNIEKQCLIRVMSGHTDRVSSLAWNEYILSSGSRSGQIFHHDVRVSDHNVATLVGHDLEVCGLAYSKDGKYLASGANDNTVKIWTGRETVPLHTLIEHSAAVKALAWCPTSKNLLASGGGTQDRRICFWNAAHGTLQHSVDTGSQVSSILWSKNTKELVTGHGYSQNQLTVWKYPTMTRLAELTGHQDRVLQLAMSPDGSTVVSLGADEALRLWKVFDCETEKKTKRSEKTRSTSSKLSMNCR